MSFTECLETCLRPGIVSGITSYRDSKTNTPHTVCIEGAVVVWVAKGLHSDAKPGLLWLHTVRCEHHRHIKTGPFTDLYTCSHDRGKTKQTNKFSARAPDEKYKLSL